MVPIGHCGTPYGDVLARLSEVTNVGRYIEVGVSSGDTFSRIMCKDAIGVDPAFRIAANVAANKRRVSLFASTSDAFFARTRPRRILKGPADLVFLDGLHLFEFLLRDFMNAEAVCARDSIIALHDCLPLNATMAWRDADRTIAGSAGTPFHGWWTGDVWKIVPILQQYRPDLDVMLVDAPPTGLVFVTGLNPTSRVLRRAYETIVHSYAAETDDAMIEGFYTKARIVSTDEALRILSRRSFVSRPAADLLRRLSW